MSSGFVEGSEAAEEIRGRRGFGESSQPQSTLVGWPREDGRNAVDSKDIEENRRGVSWMAWLTALFTGLAALAVIMGLIRVLP